MIKSRSGFTVIELIVVIVVISILATILVVSYIDSQKRADDTKRVDDVAKIGQALVIWPSRNDNKPLSQSNSGISGAGQGWYDYSYSGVSSIKTLLVNAKLVTGQIKDPEFVAATRDYLIANCMTSDDGRRVVMAQLNTAPAQSVTNQINGSNCDNVNISLWATQFGMNYARVF